MIRTPFGWAAQDLPDGVAFVHPGGADIASIVYRDRVRPLRRVGVLVRDHLATLPGFVATRISEPERMLTREGEHAALVTVSGTQRGEPAQLDLGYVFGDDYYCAVLGICRKPAGFTRFTELVRELTREDRQALGVRRRRFEYTPPIGWQPLARGLATQWLAPWYPRDVTWLMVYAANPRELVTDSVQSLVATLEHSGRRVEVQQPISPISVARISGQHQIVLATRDGLPPLLREVVVLDDERYTYAFEMSSHTPDRWPAARETLRALLESVRAVPSPGSRQNKPGFEFWTE